MERSRYAIPAAISDARVRPKDNLAIRASSGAAPSRTLLRLEFLRGARRSNNCGAPHALLLARLTGHGTNQESSNSAGLTPTSHELTPFCQSVNPSIRQRRQTTPHQRSRSKFPLSGRPRVSPHYNFRKRTTPPAARLSQVPSVKSPGPICQTQGKTHDARCKTQEARRKKQNVRRRKTQDARPAHRALSFRRNCRFPSQNSPSYVAQRTTNYR